MFPNTIKFFLSLHLLLILVSSLLSFLPYCVLISRMFQFCLINQSGKLPWLNRRWGERRGGEEKGFRGTGSPRLHVFLKFEQKSVGGKNWVQICFWKKKMQNKNFWKIMIGAEGLQPFCDMRRLFNNYCDNHFKWSSLFVF